MTTDDKNKKKEIQSYLEYAQAYAKKLTPSSMPAAVQIEEAFDEIVALQSKGVSLEQLVTDMNKDGLKVSLSYFKTIMNRIRAKRRKQKQNDQPTASATASPVVVSPAPVVLKDTSNPLLVEDETKELKPVGDIQVPASTVVVVDTTAATKILETSKTVERMASPTLQRAPEGKSLNIREARERAIAKIDQMQF